jgi:hypothetical protein
MAMRYQVRIVGVGALLRGLPRPALAQQNFRRRARRCRQRGARAELGDLANTQGKPEAGPFAAPAAK